MYHLPIMNDILHSQMHPNLDGLKLLQRCQDHGLLKFEPVKKRLYRTENVYFTDLQDHLQEHLLHPEQHRPILEAEELKEDPEKVGEDFHPRFHHLKKKHFQKQKDRERWHIHRTRLVGRYIFSKLDISSNDNIFGLKWNKSISFDIFRISNKNTFFALRF